MNEQLHGGMHEDMRISISAEGDSAASATYSKIPTHVACADLTFELVLLLAQFPEESSQLLVSFDEELATGLVVEQT